MKQKEREQVMFKNEGYNLSRKEITYKCSVIYHMMIE